MKETVQQYIQRILGKVGGKAPLAIQASTPKKLEKLIAGVERAKLRRRAAPEKWSVSEILIHLADAEIAGSFRMRMILGSPGCPVPAFDQDAWVLALHYEKRDARQALELFSTLRQGNLALLKTLTPDQWQLYGIHAERGKETIEHIVRLFAGHDVNHLQQIEQILKVQ